MCESKKIENPFAFPYADDLNGYSQDGMTLRDYFAAKAMQGHMSSEYGVMVHCDDNNAEALAKTFYSIADVMLKAREL